MEKADLKKAYVNGKGCINYIMEHVPFMTVEDEPRFHEIINQMIKDEEVTEFTAFTNEPRSKCNRRHKKYAKESKEADEIIIKTAQEQDDENDLAKQIMKRNQDRGKTFDSFLDKLAEKYGNDGADEEDELYEVAAKKLNKKKRASTSGSSKKKENPIKRGRVEKKKN